MPIASDRIPPCGLRPCKLRDWYSIAVYSPADFDRVYYAPLLLVLVEMTSFLGVSPARGMLGWRWFRQ